MMPLELANREELIFLHQAPGLAALAAATDPAPGSIVTPEFGLVVLPASVPALERVATVRPGFWFATCCLAH